MTKTLTQFTGFADACRRIFEREPADRIFIQSTYVHTLGQMRRLYSIRLRPGQMVYRDEGLYYTT